MLWLDGYVVTGGQCCKREEILWSASLPFLHGDTSPYLCCPPSSFRARTILLKIQHPQKPFRLLCTISLQANSPVWHSQNFSLLSFYSWVKSKLHNDFRSNCPKMLVVICTKLPHIVPTKIAPGLAEQSREAQGFYPYYWRGGWGGGVGSGVRWG